jgi:aldehyde:ferredoxin oxidoreductase
LLQARYGWDDLPQDVLESLGCEAIMLERGFNGRAGFTSADDRLPEWMTEEPLPPHGAVFDVPAAELDKLFGE